MKVSAERQELHRAPGPAAASSPAGAARAGARAVPYLYLLPAMLALAVFVYWPLARTIQLSLLDWNLVSPSRRYVGLRNFASLASNPVFWISVANTMRAAAGLIVTTVLAPLALAVAVVGIRGPLRFAYRAVIFSPAVVSMAVASVVWLWIYNPLNGILAQAARAAGGQGIAWLTNPRLAIWAIIAVTSWKTFGYNFVLFLAGLLAIPQDVVEAARMDGAAGWTAFRRVIWPLLSPTTLFVFLTTCVLAPQALFIPTQILTEGGPNEHSNNLGFIVWQQGFELFRVGLASSIAVVIFAALLGLALLQLRMFERGVHYE
jgi:sn-glycerol 3-phosphate transport system permease protein